MQDSNAYPSQRNQQQNNWLQQERSKNDVLRQENKKYYQKNIQLQEKVTQLKEQVKNLQFMNHVQQDQIKEQEIIGQAIENRVEEMKDGIDSGDQSPLNGENVHMPHNLGVDQYDVSDSGKNLEASDLTPSKKPGEKE